MPFIDEDLKGLKQRFKDTLPNLYIDITHNELETLIIRLEAAEKVMMCRWNTVAHESAIQSWRKAAGK